MSAISPPCRSVCRLLLLRILGLLLRVLGILLGIRIGGILSGLLAERALAWLLTEGTLPGLADGLTNWLATRTISRLHAGLAHAKCVF